MVFYGFGFGFFPLLLVLPYQSFWPKMGAFPQAKWRRIWRRSPSRKWNLRFGEGGSSQAEIGPVWVFDQQNPGFAFRVIF